MGQWLIDIWNSHESVGETLEGRFDVRGLPGWAYARALALFINEETKIEKNHDESTKALRDAIRAFPSVVTVLADKLEAPIAGEIRGNPAFRLHIDASSLSKESDAILHLLSHLYVQRSVALWKLKTRSIWFTETVNSLIPFKRVSSSSPSSPTSLEIFNSLFSNEPLRSSIYRHTLVLESTTRRLFGFLPSTVINAKQLACDPFPPMTRVNEYNEKFFEGTEDPFAIKKRSKKENERLLERLIPDPVFRRQLQDFFQAHPEFAERFPGGIVQFAQVAAELPEHMIEDLMIAEAHAGGAVAAGGVQPGQMPGGMFGFGEEENGDAGVGVGVGIGVGGGREGGDLPPLENADDGDGTNEEADEEDEEDLEPVQPLPIRMIRNVLNRFWGGGGGVNVQEDSSDDEEVPANQPGFAEDNDVD